MAEAADEDFLMEAAFWTLEQKARWNALVPVSHLPQEILLKIFSYHCYEEPSPTHLPTWLSITHVCRLFRSISLNCPSLWNRIVLSSSEWTQVMLARAGMVPLEIHAYFPIYRQRIQLQNLCTVLSHLPRIRTLSLLGASTISRDVMAALIAHPAPLLESFTHNTNEEDPSPNFPDNIFQGGQVPRLKELWLIGCNFNWTSPLFRDSLISLSLRCGNDMTLPSMSTLLDILRRMPFLEHLALANPIFPYVDSFQTDSTPLLDCRVPLLHLQDLNLKSNVLDCYEFVRHLIISSSSTITTDLDHDDEDSDYTSSITAMCGITRLLCLETTPGAGSLETEAAPILALRVMNPGGGGLKFEAATDIEEGPGAEWKWKHVKYFMSLTLSRHESDLSSSFLIRISSDLPLSSLKDLSIRGEFWLSMYDWNHVLTPKLNSLHILQISGSAIFGFIEGVKTTIPPLSDIGTLHTTTQVEQILPSPFMPRLTSLWIERADLKGNCELFNGLVDVLKYRKEVAHLPLHTLHLTTCNVSSWQVDELSRWVLSPIKWDQCQGGMDRMLHHALKEAYWEEEESFVDDDDGYWTEDYGDMFFDED